MTRVKKRASSEFSKSNIITSRRRTRAKVNYNENSDDEGRKSIKKKQRYNNNNDHNDDDDDDPTSFNTSSESSSNDDDDSDDDSDDLTAPSGSDSESDQPSRRRQQRGVRSTKKLLATLPSRKRTESIRKLTRGPPSKRKLAAASKHSVRRVNSVRAAITPLRQVTSGNGALTSYELARERLHVSAVPDSLPCREDEFDEISGYLESALQEGTGTCIYISGVPGTGKTATVLEVIRGLQYRSEQDVEDIPAFDFVEINGMKLTDANHAYSLLWDSLNHDKTENRKKVTSAHALELLENRFSEEDSDEKITVVLMDELDLLVTKKQTVMYNFFEWPSRPHSKLIVVAIANTMDLPERILSNKIYSRIGAKRINFQAYTHHQLYEIVESRLKGTDAFENDAVEFAARKVSAVSGDARRALDICRRAVEIVEQQQQQPQQPQQQPQDNKKKKGVTIAIVNQAIKEMFSSPSVAFIQSCSLHQKLFLISVMQRVRQIGLAEIEFGDVAQHHLQTCQWHHLEPPTTSDLMRICESLGQARALVVEGGRLDLGMRITNNLSEEDIVMACKSDRIVGRLLVNFNK